MKFVLILFVFSASFMKFTEGVDPYCVAACGTTYAAATALNPSDETAFCEAAIAYVGCLTSCGEDTTSYLKMLKDTLDGLGFTCDLPKPDTGSGSGSVSGSSLPCGLLIVLDALLLAAYKIFDL